MRQRQRGPRAGLHVEPDKLGRGHGVERPVKLVHDVRELLVVDDDMLRDARLDACRDRGRHVGGNARSAWSGEESDGARSYLQAAICIGRDTNLETER